MRFNFSIVILFFLIACSNDDPEMETIQTYGINQVIYSCIFNNVQDPDYTFEVNHVGCVDVFIPNSLIIIQKTHCATLLLNNDGSGTFTAGSPSEQITQEISYTLLSETDVIEICTETMDCTNYTLINNEIRYTEFEGDCAITFILTRE